MSDKQLTFNLDVVPAGGTIDVNVLNGKFLPNFFLMRLYDSNNHLISEPLPANDSDNGKPNITRSMEYPGESLKGGYLLVFGAVPAPAPGKTYSYAVRVTATQANGNSATGEDTGSFTTIEPINFRVNFI